MVKFTYDTQGIIWSMKRSVFTAAIGQSNSLPQEIKLIQICIWWLYLAMAKSPLNIWRKVWGYQCQVSFQRRLLFCDVAQYCLTAPLAVQIDINRLSEWVLLCFGAIVRLSNLLMDASHFVARLQWTQNINYCQVKVCKLAKIPFVTELLWPTATMMPIDHHNADIKKFWANHLKNGEFSSTHSVWKLKRWSEAKCWLRVVS